MSDSSGIQAYAGAAFATLDRAMKSVSEPETHYMRLGDEVICLRFAGPALVPKLVPALSHLSIDPAPKPNLTIGIWDADSTGISLAPPTTDPADFIARTEIKGCTTDSIQITYEIGGGILNLLDLETNTGLFWVQSAEQVPYYESGAPLRSILAAWLQSRAYQYLHAAAIGTKDGAVILAGKGGSGKSTTAINCLSAGLFYLSDDYCVAKLTPEPTVYSLYSSGKLDPGTTRQFPQLLDMIEQAPHVKAEKTLFFLQRDHHRQIRLASPIKAILLPQITPQSETTLQRVSAAEGLTALAPSTIFQLPGAGRKAFQFIAALVRKVPVYQLRLSSRLDEIPLVIRNFLGTLDGQ